MKNATFAALAATIPALILSSCSDNSPVDIAKEMASVVTEATELCKQVQEGKKQASDVAGDITELATSYAELKDQVAKISQDAASNEDAVKEMGEFAVSEEGKKMAADQLSNLKVIATVYATTQDAKLKEALGKFLGR